VYLTAADRLVPYIVRTVSFVIRSERVGTAGFLEDVQQAVWSVNADLPLASVQTLEDVHRRSLERTSLTLVLLAIIGGMALLLGVVGIYGVLSYALSQRTREVGIRIALGAQNSTVQRLFFRQGLSVVAIGAAIGLAGAAALTRLMGVAAVRRGPARSCDLRGRHGAARRCREVRELFAGAARNANRSDGSAAVE
jgi:predicted lysophospholipase L1 biosynthesis ABC-type transport system permease subunit